MNVVAVRSFLLSAVLALIAQTALAQPEGEPDPRVLQAQAFESGRGAPQDFTLALQLYRQAAEDGHPGGLNGLARAYADGRGVARDPARAMQLFAEAAAQGNPVHMTDYAQALESGVAGEPNPAEAVIWYQRAADAGYVPAITSLGVLALEGSGMERDPALALQLFEQAATAGDARAQSNLGLMYSRGEDVERNYAQAARLFQAAAAQGLPEALRNLSVLYANGHGVPVDEALSEQLLRQARLASGLELEAVLEAIGLGFDQRLSAPDWTRPPGQALTAAARAGDPVALYLSGYQLLLGAGVRQDVLEGEARLQIAAELGLPSASLALALAYARGSGVPQDFEEAYYWASRAAFAQTPEAMGLRDALTDELPQDAIARAQARLRPPELSGE